MQNITRIQYIWQFTLSLFYNYNQYLNNSYRLLVNDLLLEKIYLRGRTVK
jgi:hypothetical protein